MKYAPLQVGQKVGRLTLIEQVRERFLMWRVRCECGEIRVVYDSGLKRGDTRSCGCLKIELQTTHGASRSPTYQIWAQMLFRCNSPSAPKYKNYGGRGIKVCARWGRFENFLEDMGEAPRGLTLDRIDNDGNYCPSNCRWTDRSTQARNMRRSVFLTLRGVRRHLYEWAEILNIHSGTLHSRHRLGWSDERILTEPVMRKHPAKNQQPK